MTARKMLLPRICVIFFTLCIIRESRCAYVIQGQMNVPSATDISNAAGTTLNTAGNLAGQTVNDAGNLAGQAVNGVGQLAGGAVNAVGNAAKTVGNAAGYVVTAAGNLASDAGQAITNVAMFPINKARESYNSLQVHMTKLQVQMASYKQALINGYNQGLNGSANGPAGYGYQLSAGSQQTPTGYQYQSAMLDSIAVVDLQPYVDNVNQDLMPYGQALQITKTAAMQGYIFPTIIDANATAYSFPRGFSIQGQDLTNARGMDVGAVAIYQPSNGGAVLNDPAGNQYVLGNDIYLDMNGNLRYRANNQPWAIAGQYAIDLGGNVYDSGGNIIGNLCRCIGITGSFGPNGKIVLT